MNITEKIVDEWFNRLDKGYAVEPYTRNELRILRNVITENSQLIREQLYGGSELLTEASYLSPEYKPGRQIIFNKEKPPKWAPNLKTGDVLTIVDDDESLETIGSGEFVKTLQLPDGTKVRIAATKRDGGDSNLFIHASNGGATPRGEDWEALIVTAFNGIDESSDEWKRARIFWENYGEEAQKVAESFRRIVKSSKLTQLGSSTAALKEDWGGANNTPKTDILGNSNERISLKKAGGSQLMSGKVREALATFDAAMKMVGENRPQSLISFLDTLEEKMGQMSERGTITALEKLRDSGKELTPEQEKSIAQMEQLQLNAKEINRDMDEIFKDMYFKSCFCFEAATGTNKFADKNAVANLLIEFKPSGEITAHLPINKIEDAQVLANKNKFFVSFKTGSQSSYPYLALRTRPISKKKLTAESNVDTYPTFRNIIIEEFSKYTIGTKLLLEGEQQQLNEFEIFNKLIKGVKSASKRVVKQVKNILTTIMKRIREAVSYIKTLGKKMFNAILNFLGFDVEDVSIVSSGPFPLINESNDD